MGMALPTLRPSVLKDFVNNSFWQLPVLVHLLPVSVSLPPSRERLSVEENDKVSLVRNINRLTRTYEDEASKERKLRGIGWIGQDRFR